MEQYDTSKHGLSVYVACLSAYNQSKLHGAWIDLSPAETTVEDVRAEIAAMLEQSPADGLAEEWGIHDHSGFGPVGIDEHEDIEVVMDLVELVREFGELALHVASRCGGLGDLGTTKEALQEHYAGSGESLGSWAEEHLSDTGELQAVPARWHSFIDFDRYARDLEAGGEVWTVQLGGEVHVFWNR